MIYTPINFESLLGIPGLSDQLLKNHFALYQGYVANVNKLTDELNALLKEEKTGTPSYAELKRRLGWEFNGMRLHEFYFGNLTKGESKFQASSVFAKKIPADFGSYEAWEKDFKAVSAMRGIGWAVLYYDPVAKKLFNAWINEHDAGHFAGCKPLLIFDVFEHAYMLDYGIKRADYIEASIKIMDWKTIENRFIEGPNSL